MNTDKDVETTNIESDNKPFIGLVSVIIPVFNAGDSIKECVGSLLKQTYSNIEIILVDDGSTDLSGEICDDIARTVLSKKTVNASQPDMEALSSGESDSNMILIKVIHTENGGVSRARNTGLKSAQGEWITFVDADDVVATDYVSRLVNAVNSFKAPSQSKDPAVTPHRDYPLMMVTMTERIQADTIMSGYYYIEHGVLNEDSHVWGKLYNKKEVNTFLGDEWFPEGLTIGEDMLMLLEMAVKQEHKKVFKAIPAGSYIYTENEQGAMLKAYKPSYLDQIKCWDRAEEILEACKGHISDYVYVRLAQIQIMAALLVAGKIAVTDRAEVCNYDEAMREIRRAIKHALKRNGAFASLSAGYKIKTTIFRLSPDLYLKMYGRWKA